MGLGRKLRSGFLQAMGLAAIYYLILSLAFPQVVQVKHFYFLVSLVIPIYLFGAFTFELKLFSRKLWVRRLIVTLLSSLHAIAISILFGYLWWERRILIIFGIAMAVGIVIDIFLYYVADVIQKRNLEAINQKLAEQNKEN